MTWGAEQWLWGLCLPALLLLWELFVSSRKALNKQFKKAKFASAGFGKIKESSGKSARSAKLLLCIALAFLCISISQPRWGTEKRMTFERSREVIIAIDLSKSMLAQDIKPNRLQRAKLVVESMLSSLQGESVGLIAFAGTAFLQSPMSPDYQILRGFLKEINPSFIPQGGTNYERMIQTALDSFEQSDGMADRFLIVISDGESLDDNWKKAAQELKSQNVKAICLGFGTQAGGFIPDGAGGYHKDAQGAVVLSRLERGTLQELAQITGGLYQESNVWIDLANLVEETVKKGRAELTEREREFTEIERYHYFLVPGLLALLLSLYKEFPSLPKARIYKTEDKI